MNKPDAKLPSPKDLLSWLIDHQFLTESLGQSLLSSPASCADAMSLSKELLQRDLLTPYQINQILQGNGERLLLGPYRVVERLGEGAMGQVMKCWSQKLQMFVAVKMIHKEHLASKKALNRFFREMETAGKLDHPNIVLLRDADRIADCPFMVMEFVEGTDLSRLVKQAGPLAIEQAADFARQTALGLQHAFERGVVHRDIKPGNLLITRDPRPIVKISDFGLARLESERSSERRLTQQGTVLGTIDYIAPEQAENAHSADIRSDIYSLGCTLCFLLTGKPPFGGATLTEKISAHLKGDPVDIRIHRPEIPSDLIAVLKCMMARHRTDRYQTPADAALALQPFCGEAGSRRATSAPTRPGTATKDAAGARNPFSFSRSDNGETLQPRGTSAAAPSGSNGKGRRLVGRRAFWIGGVVGGCALVIALLWWIGVWNWIAPMDGYGSGPPLSVAFKEPERYLKRGDRKTIILTVKRRGLAGPVVVTLDNLPDGVAAFPNKFTIDADKDHGEATLVVYQFAVNGAARSAGSRLD